MRTIRNSGMLFLALIFLLSAQAVQAQKPPVHPFPEEGKRERLREEI